MLGVENALEAAGRDCGAGIVRCRSTGSVRAMAPREQKIQALLAPTVTAMGFELWGLEHLPQGRRSLLRLYIDAEDGVTVDDCAEVSRQVSGVLDVEAPINGAYTLEVSSPGVDRLLFQPGHYLAYVGEWIELRLRSPYEGRRKFGGILGGLEGDDVVVQVDDTEYLLPLGMVERAQVKPGRRGSTQ